MIAVGRRGVVLLVLLASAVVVIGLVVVLSGPSSARLPSKSVWAADVDEAMEGSHDWLDQRVERGGRRLALNLDIDNTSIASHYDPGDPVEPVLALARYARSKGVVLLFNTGRADTPELRASTLRQLDRNGYVVTELCMRRVGEATVPGKERCRRQFVDEGYTLIANIGNNDTDFVGGDYERAFRLPSYDGELN